MRTISTAVAGIILMLVTTGCGQPTGVAAAADAMGATTVNSIEYSGSGSTFAFGQAPSPGARWPRFDAKSYVAWLGRKTGKRYRIRHGRMMNIDQLDRRGRHICGWCFFPEGHLVAGDVMLAQKLSLELFETEALEIANRF